MARALLREEQIGDIDNLSEPEHDVLVHENLVTSGTLNFQDGTISGTGDVYANAYHGDGSTLSGVGGGNPESLYYNTTDVKATATSAGIEITDGTYTGSIVYSSEKLTIKNTALNGNIEFSANYDGSQVIFYKIATAGFADWHRFYNKNGTQIAQFSNTGYHQYNSGVIENSFGNVANINTWYGSVHGRSSRIQAEDSTGAPQHLFRGYPDGAAELYYAGEKRLETAGTGAVNFYNTGTTQYGAVLHNGGQFALKNFVNSGAIGFYGLNSVGGQETLALFQADGSCKLYQNNTVALETYANGITVSSTAGAQAVYGFNVSSLYIYNYEHGGTIEIWGENTATTQKQMAVFDPDAGVELNYDGEKQFETVVSGVEIPVDNFMYFGDPTTSGSWRMGVSLEDFVHQKYDGADWVTKQTVVG